jgi:hypothetical protein
MKRKTVLGVVAQLVEHLLCKQKDTGSSPVCSTMYASLVSRAGVHEEGLKAPWYTRRTKSSVKASCCGT